MTALDVDARLRVAPWLVVGVILLVAGIAYRDVTAHDFVLDDSHTIKHNPALRSLAFAPQWLTSPYATSGIREFANYRPVLVASYALDYALWGDRPVGYHATNLAIHFGVVILGFVLARLLWRDDPVALCAAALIALHPINAEAVNYLTARSSSLMTGLVLATIWASERPATGSHRLWSVVAYGFGLAALGTKEAAVVLPLLMIAWDRASRVPPDPWRTTLRRSIPWWVLVGGFLIVRLWVLGGQTEPAISGPGVTLGQNLLFAVKICLSSLGSWFWPVGSAVDHAWPTIIGPREAAVLLTGLGVAIAVTVWLARVRPRYAWCAVWFWAAILPLGALAFTSRLTLYQDHRAYLGGIGLAWLVGHTLVLAARRWCAGRGARVVLAVTVIACVVVTVRVDAARTAVWASRVTLWDHVLATYPTSIMAHNAKGIQALEAGRLDDAKNWFVGALKLAPGFSEAHKNLGIVFSRQGDWDRAAAALEFALAINPHYSEARVNLGKVYEHVGRHDLALEAYDRLLADDPGELAVLKRTAYLLEQQGRWADAAARYRAVLGQNPSDREAQDAVARLRGRSEGQEDP
jgi:tetratricopeptide (TPR) repeat protein